MVALHWVRCHGATIKLQPFVCGANRTYEFTFNTNCNTSVGEKLRAAGFRLGETVAGCPHVVANAGFDLEAERGATQCFDQHLKRREIELGAAGD